MHKALKYLGVLLLAGIISFAPASVVASCIDENGSGATQQDCPMTEQGASAAGEQNDSAATPTTNPATTSNCDAPSNDCEEPAQSTCPNADEDCGNTAADSYCGCNGDISSCTKAHLAISYNKCGLNTNCNDNSCAEADSNDSSNCDSGNCFNDNTQCTTGNTCPTGNTCTNTCTNTNNCTNAGNSSDNSDSSQNNCASQSDNSSAGNNNCGMVQNVATAAANDENCASNCVQLANAEEWYSLIFAALSNADNPCNSDLLAAIQNYLWRYFQSQNISLTNASQVTAASDATQTTSKTSVNAYQLADEYAAEVIRLVNIERVSAGLDELVTDQSLCEAAVIRAAEIQSNFSHTRPDGSSCFTALSEINAVYNSAGENIAIGQNTPQEVVKAWMDSPGHRANILNASFGRIGVASLANSSGIYGGYAWAQFFAD